MTRHRRTAPTGLLPAALLILAGCATNRAPANAREAAPAAPGVQLNAVAAALAPGIKLDADDPTTCAPCHAPVVAEWQDSLHSRAHHAADPLYATMRTLRLEKQGPHIPALCANCHNPRDPADHESMAARGGVTCATCHQLDGVHLVDGKKGVAALVVGAALTFRGPHPFANGTAPLHATGPALDAIADGKTVCLACHAEEKNPAGLSTCSTGIEYAEGGESRSCADCHMPLEQAPSGAVTQRPTHKSHRFLGPHQAQRIGEDGLLATAVALSGRFEGGKLVVKLENKSGHSFPTGFPARMVVLDVRALDASGKEVYRNITSDPMKEHPEGVLNKAYVDAEGKPALAPFAAKLVRDSRLKPAEVREVSVAVPATAVRAELGLRFFLAAPQMLKTINYQGPEAKPVTMARVAVSR